VQGTSSQRTQINPAPLTASEGTLARALPGRRKTERAPRMAIVQQGRRGPSAAFAAMVDFSLIILIGTAYILLSHRGFSAKVCVQALASFSRQTRRLITPGHRVPASPRLMFPGPPRLFERSSFLEIFLATIARLHLR